MVTGGSLKVDVGGMCLTRQTSNLPLPNVYWFTVPPFDGLTAMSFIDGQVCGNRCMSDAG